jgi:uncharacterized membrane protein YfcA
VSGAEIVLACSTVFLGSCLQGSVGFGLGMLGGPVLALLDPGLVPGPLLLLATVLTCVVAAVERDRLDIEGAKWALAGRVPGTVVGAVLVVALPERWLALALAVAVLAGTAAGVLGWRPDPSPRAVATAGAVSGVFGTATAVGGPPMAVVWQGEEARRRRATMSAFFLVGCLMSVTALGVTGSITAQTLRTAALLLPFVLAGYAASRLLNRRMDVARLRALTLVVCAVGATLLAVRQLI